MAGYGVPEAEIAGVIGVSPKTLRKHYRGELDHGHIKANAKVAENLYRKATGEGREAVIAAIFWLKTRAGPRDLLAEDPRRLEGDACHRGRRRAWITDHAGGEGQRTRHSPGAPRANVDARSCCRAG